MAPKKTKKGGTKKSTKKGAAKKKKEEVEKKNIYEIPEFIDPKLYTPQVDLTIRLASPVSDYLSNVLSFYLIRLPNDCTYHNETGRHQGENH
jgi:hypothetical protein